MVHPCYMERLSFCALIKHIFKTDLQKDKFLNVKNFISVHMETLPLNAVQKRKIRSSLGLKIKTLDLHIINLCFVNL